MLSHFNRFLKLGNSLKFYESFTSFLNDHEINEEQEKPKETK